MSIKATRSDLEHLPCVITGNNQTAVAYTVDMGGGKSSVCTYQEQSPTLACTHYGEPAVAYTLKTRGGICHTLNSDSRNYVVIPIAVLGGGREHSTICMDGTAPTLCTFQDSKPILIARVDNAEIL